ncbi:NAD(P)/FAD-dependent oxidoreductase [Salinadaptatus halalkaliphilus]|uniref:NAD(P)/FAD-dependent oxidoreductase n=1 Tax=Salinadaptatus halalkaliphilus TaxID=2419781 RepID=UPI001FE415C7|nr:FAD-dependent oxidoreductase [Salinadaptatus halalkaliphilus]
MAPTLFFNDQLDVAHHANAFFREFDGTAEFSFTERERIDIVTEGEATEATQLATRLADEGCPVRYLEAEDVSEQFPQFDLEEFAGAVLYEDTGWVDPYTYATALQTTAMARGATFELDVEVTDIRVDNDQIEGLETDDGTVDADVVVIAAGWRTRSLLPDDIDVPIQPYRTQIVVLEPETSLSDEFPLGRVGTEHVYFRPEHNGDLLVGGSHHTTDDPRSTSTDADESFRVEIADLVPEFIRGFEDADLVNGWAGVDVASPDTSPIIDSPANAPEGLVVATGFNGLGIMTSPVVGPTVRARLTGSEPEFSTEPFATDRFEGVGVDFDYISTSDI